MNKPPIRAPRPRVRRQISTFVAVSGLMLFVMPATAGASSYHDFLCRIPYGPSAGRAAPTDGVSYAPNGSFVFSGDSCASGGSLYAAISGETTHPYGASATTAFTAPAGMTIRQFAVWRYEQDGPVQPFGAPASNLQYSPGPASVEGLCAQSLGCSVRGTPNSALDPSNAVGVTSLSGVTQIIWSAACGGGPGGTCPASGTASSSRYDVYAADVDLTDNTPPAVTSIAGPLVASGTLTGEQSVSFTASDGQSGIYSGSLIVDGHPVVSQILDSNGGACQSLGITSDGQRSFEHAQPCKSTVSTILTLNTSHLTAGQHTLQLLVEDAAGNHTIAYNATITAAGPPPIEVDGGPITGGHTAPHIANGDPCAGEKLDLLVNGLHHTPTTRFGKPVTVKGVLHCGTIPVRGAQILITTVGATATTAINSTIQTGLDGSFSYVVPKGPGRLLQFSYTAYSDDPGPSATATATISIRPAIKLRISPRFTRNGHAIHWKGTIFGGPFPPQGVTLDVEVRQGRHWKIFDQVVASRTGRFHYSYRFHATNEPTTYWFRVALPANGSGGYPYTPGASNPIHVRVNP